MRSWLACIAAVLWLPSAILWAGEPPVSYSKFCVTCGIAGADSIASFTGQFIVHGTTLPLRPLANRNPNAPGYIELNPQMVAVTGERLKRAFLDELTVPDSYRHKIHIVLLPQAPPDRPVTIVSRIYRDGVQHQMGVPARVDQTRFLKSLVQVLLSDLASRGSNRAAELPTWLVEGMTRHLLARVAPALVVNTNLVTYTISGYDRLHEAREVLSTNTCLTFHELSFPENPMSELEGQVYQSSAQLFLHELLELRDGPKLLVSFIAGLRSSLNWQTAFYNAYGDHFQSALEIEKWWALSWLHFKNRQERQDWPVTLSLQKLNNVLTTTMQYRSSLDSVPENREVPLQQLILHENFAAQKGVLNEKLTQLYFLGFNMPDQTRELLAEYQSAIQSYLERRATLGVQPTLRREPDYNLDLLLRSTARRLDELDRKRSSLRLTASATP